ncbi:MAG TPA: macro domain-containing protein [Nitrospirota bacterium]|nr:macro domain-containing protein [Nitrospirota bacterium]
MHMLEKPVNGVTVRLISADLTERDVDAIVNAANDRLQHGGGVAGAIVRKGGRIIQEESDRIGFAAVGTAVITTGGTLKARHVIHAVGPRMGEGDEDNKLRRAMNSVLKLATENGLTSISVPAISAGIFGFPKDRCAKILVNETVAFLKNGPKSALKLVEFCIFDQEAYAFFKSEFEKI